MGDAPDGVFIPVGNAGNITAYWKGFVEARAVGMSARRPRMFGFQAEGSAPIVQGHPVSEPKTVATAIRIGNPASWKGAVAARDESGGAIEAVADQEILEAYRLLARGEGVFCEPASAACVAGLLKLAGRGVRFDKQRLVCIITGSGLKDPDLAAGADAKVTSVPAKIDAVEQAMGLV
jgi:threonine synthase